jgi:hypothetical protein
MLAWENSGFSVDASVRITLIDRLADLIPQPRRHRHRDHGVFAPNHPLRPAVTALAVGNLGKQRDAVTSGHAEAGHAAGDCCNTHEKPRSHDTSRIAWAKLMARVGEESLGSMTPAGFAAACAASASAKASAPAAHAAACQGRTHP